MVSILSDSTCDLSKELVERYKIKIVPLHIMLGDKEYKDGVDITADEIYAWSDAHKTTPKTSAISIEDAMCSMKEILATGNDIVAFSISSSMSTTSNVFYMAAEELEATDRVAVVDSMNLSTGIGHLVIAAAILANEGKGKEEIVAAMEALRPNVRASFVVDTLTYLHRGGRCSGLAAMAGGVLKLHPEIVVKDGTMGVGKKYRGRLDRAIMQYVEELEEELRKAKPERVFITHSGCEEQIVQMVYDYLKNLNYFSEIFITRAGGVISSHCGYGTLGVLFVAQ